MKFKKLILLSILVPFYGIQAIDRFDVIFGVCDAPIHILGHSMVGFSVVGMAKLAQNYFATPSPISNTPADQIASNTFGLRQQISSFVKDLQGIQVNQVAAAKGGDLIGTLMFSGLSTLALYWYIKTIREANQISSGYKYLLRFGKALFETGHVRYI